jgi:hypothetical protein
MILIVGRLAILAVRLMTITAVTALVERFHFFPLAAHCATLGVSMHYY